MADFALLPCNISERCPLAKAVNSGELIWANSSKIFYKEALKAVEAFVRESTDEVTMAMFTRFCRDHLEKEKTIN